ncbi:Protein CBG27740 [Caenorhabditis briggsae]|uniref:Protein CBG27740 n=1 Tax=Caenorhabditis briggsae TaxID=6238 RepID=B6IJ38_CAEBR|nr:Protein CBG27740 [Caenorhabditis briggsae]CAS00018.1 Protein CBG27740 [Caenorhabditis briggsae]
MINSENHLHKLESGTVAESFSYNHSFLALVGIIIFSKNIAFLYSYVISDDKVIQYNNTIQNRQWLSFE